MYTDKQIMIIIISLPFKCPSRFSYVLTLRKIQSSRAERWSIFHLMLRLVLSHVETCTENGVLLVLARLYNKTFWPCRTYRLWRDVVALVIQQSKLFMTLYCRIKEIIYAFIKSMYVSTPVNLVCTRAKSKVKHSSAHCKCFVVHNN